MNDYSIFSIIRFVGDEGFKNIKWYDFKKFFERTYINLNSEEYKTRNSKNDKVRLFIKECKRQELIEFLYNIISYVNVDDNNKKEYEIIKEIINKLESNEEISILGYKK